MNVVWTDAERDFVRDNAGDLKDRQVAEALTLASGRPVTLDAVRKARRRLGITKAGGRGVCKVVRRGRASL
jgi:hypothetical protein